MAEQILYDVATTVINKLSSSALREFQRISGVKDELEKLNKTVESIKVMISNAEQQGQDEDANIKHWIGRFKQVLRDADDLVDDLLLKDQLRRANHHTKMATKVRDFFSSQNPLAFPHKLAGRVDNIRKKVNDVAEDMSKLKLNSSLVTRNQDHSKQDESVWRETGSFVLQSDIIGREENKKEIMELLNQTPTNQNVSLIAIVGMGGLGKTALAQLVYNDAREQKLFDKWIWVCVSEDFQVKSVVKNMLKSLKNDDLRVSGLDQLQRMLREELNGERYMLVLDDVWNENPQKWHDLNCLLICGAKGSKILVTTRSTRVSKAMDVKNPYILKGLNEEKSWTLLKKLAVGEDAYEMSPNQESIGKNIAKKCGGVPLAIRAVGGFLKMNREEHQWSSILDDDAAWRLCEEREGIMPVLELSYKHLPLGLRQCFAYCCLYPKDWEIEKEELIQLWMAQGYLQSSNEMHSMEELGNRYVEILLMRSFFQDASFNVCNDIIFFKMHDLMHDLAMSVAGNDCYLYREGKEIVGGTMHASFLGSTVFPFDSLDVSMRTLLTRNIVQFVFKPSIIKNLKNLRSLSLSGSSITELPESIDKCKHLRYLDLSYCTDLISLPKSMGNLVCLQSLKLRVCWKLSFDNEVVTKLINLRHLDIEGCKAFEYMPRGIGQLTSLQSLLTFSVGDNEDWKRAKLNELKELNNIRGSLEINGLNLVNDVVSESQDANIKAKKDIQILTLNWKRQRITGVENKNNILSWSSTIIIEEVKNDNCLQLLDNLCPHQNVKILKVSDYPGERFSSWLPSLTNIVEIILWELTNCQQLPPLERLPQLKRLQICFADKLKYMCYEGTSPSVFFPSLEELVLLRCPQLEGWQLLANDVDNHHSLPSFTHLSYLQIGDCLKLTCMPTYPHLVRLILHKFTMKSVIETCSSSYNPLSGLKFLHIGDVVDIEVMPDEWMQNLTSLECLSLSSISISLILRHLQHVPVELQKLEIESVDDLDLWMNDEDFALYSLQKISIGCSSAKTLPERICDLKSLRHIEIDHCRNLESLPEGMCILSNLQTLTIRGCPNLRDRCQTETGEDWPKIAHIPNIIMGPSFV